jgi:hypothetical protein
MRAFDGVPGNERGRARLASKARTIWQRRRQEKVAGSSPASASARRTDGINMRRAEIGHGREGKDVQGLRNLTLKLNLQTTVSERDDRRRNLRNTPAARVRYRRFSR